MILIHNFQMTYIFTRRSVTSLKLNYSVRNGYKSTFLFFARISSLAEKQAYTACSKLGSKCIFCPRFRTERH